MKKILFVLAVLVFGLLVIGCPEKEEEDPKVVAEEYRGVFIYNTNGVTEENNRFKYTENRVFSWGYIENVDNIAIKGWSDRGAAWTVGADLYIIDGKRKNGTFTDVNTLDWYPDEGITWTYTRTTEYP